VDDTACDGRHGAHGCRTDGVKAIWAIEVASGPTSSSPEAARSTSSTEHRIRTVICGKVVSDSE
jgi:hypothetical protein